MKKILIIGAIAAIAALTLGAAGLAYAQTSTPQGPANPPSGLGQGMMNGQGAYGNGWMGGGIRAQAVDGTYGPLHEYMAAAIEKYFGLTADELQAQHDAGKTLWDYAQEKGITSEQFAELMTQVRTEAYNNAAAAGAITQAQADFMLQRMSRQQAAGNGPGSGTCDGTGPHGMGRQGGMGGRWNLQP
jgi:hypothetical protein